MEKSFLKFCVQPEVSLEEALRAINSGHHGFAVAIDSSHKLIGTLTDGDIRRAILSGAKLSDSVAGFVQKNCVVLPPNTPRENLLRHFDQRIRFLPVVDAEGILKDILTIDDVLYKESPDLTSKARAPARISFGGGGTDLTPFFIEHSGAVLNATINLYSRSTVTKRPGTSQITITSEDLGQTIEAESWESLTLDGNADLLKAVVRRLQPNFGFHLSVASDFPPSSGLGGSSVVLAAVIGAFNQFREDKLSLYDVAEMAFQVERLELKCSGGWQDQYAAVFGGVNFMEFRKDRNEINSLKIASDILNELEDRLIVCYSGGAHPVNSIHKAQAVKMVSDQETTRFAHQTRDLAFSMKHALQRGHIDDLGKMLHEAWLLKQNFSSDISNPHLESMYQFARENGAVGGKILGAGGGGYFLFQAKPFARRSLLKALQQKGYLAQSVMFDHAGLQSWLVKGE